ncbi:hypothetical protein ACH5RR_022508 [Cinchona calisaya]|uniref:Phytocyanin domain-containing protein n=1 Tax=Cinchona calisaya TaxID=153742 RepID=A0ABD2Z9U5_9GENT
MSKAKVMTIFGTMVFLCIFIQSNIVSADTFIVGDSNGWNINVSGWENSKIFRAEDVLVFKYPKGVHNVVKVVDRHGYTVCDPTGGEEYNSGNDSITLKEGGNGFICSVGSHCTRGMKIFIDAEADSIENLEKK